MCLGLLQLLGSICHVDLDKVTWIDAEKLTSFILSAQVRWVFSEQRASTHVVISDGLTRFRRTQKVGESLTGRGTWSTSSTHISALLVRPSSQPALLFTLTTYALAVPGPLFDSQQRFRAPVLRPLTAWLPRPGGPRPRVLHACEAHRGDGSAKSLGQRWRGDRYLRTHI